MEISQDVSKEALTEVKNSIYQTYKKPFVKREFFEDYEQHIIDR